MRSTVLPLAISLIASALVACQAQTSPFVPVVAVGSPAPVIQAGPPDEASKQIALAGIHSAALIGPAVRELAQLTGAFYDAKGKYSRYRVMSGPEGWEFRNGWYWRTDNSASRTMRAHFEDATGAGPLFDVTFDVNYGPEMHPGFPAGLTQLRAELTQELPSGGRVALTVMAALPGDRTERISAFGSGSASLPIPLGQAGFEALNATFTATGAVEPGDLVLKSLTGGTTRQFSGRYNAEGLEGTAQVLFNAQPLGTVGLHDGQWQLRNSSGNHPLP